MWYKVPHGGGGGGGGEVSTYVLQKAMNFLSVVRLSSPSTASSACRAFKCTCITWRAKRWGEREETQSHLIHTQCVESYNTIYSLPVDVR